jgi:peptide deformylase
MRILEYPDPGLKLQARPLDKESGRHLRALVRRMTRAMRDAPGIGLAATQVGVQERVIVYEIEDEVTALVNPRVVDVSEERSVEEEGCLSFPGLVVPIERPVRVVCDATTIDGEPVTVEADDLTARVIQHEIDHLDGVLITDRADPDERKAALKRYRQERL